MKSLKDCFWGIFFVVAVAGQPLHGAQGGSTVEAVVESVDQKISLLDQIIHHAMNIVDFPDRGNRSRSKKELIKLMNNKELDAKIKDAIKSDIEIIKNGKTTYAVNAAFQRLLATYNKINAQANVVDTIAEATEMVKNASPEELKEAIAQAKKKIEEAQEEEQGIMGRWYSKAKKMVTRPVNYVFGEESSYAKTAFYAAVGAAILAAGAYGAYQYGINSGIDQYKESEKLLAEEESKRRLIIEDRLAREKMIEERREIEEGSKRRLAEEKDRRWAKLQEEEDRRWAKVESDLKTELKLLLLAEEVELYRRSK